MVRGVRDRINSPATTDGDSEATASKTRDGTKLRADAKSKVDTKSKADKPASSGERILELLAFDAQMRKKWLRHPKSHLLGTDEVGRGCLAGPVVAAAVHLPAQSADSDFMTLLSRLNDSKKLSPQVRQELSVELKSRCSYAIAEASVDEIDKINILQASFLAMNRAIEKLSVDKTEAVVLVDGNRKISNQTLRQILVIGGDGLSASIAAASVIAKVYRDDLMCRLHEDFPHYQWNSNKGYGAKVHRDAILEHGLTEWHRKSFCVKLGSEQLTLGELN